MKRSLVFCLLIIFCFFILLVLPDRSFGKDKDSGKDLEDKAQVYAIQNRVYHCYHEIALQLGYIPDDDFYYLYPIGLSYTFNFNEHLAWEVARGYLALNQEKELKKDLENNFGATPEKFSKTTYMLHSHVVLKPLYGKDAVWNRSVLNHESYLFFGGGVVGYENQLGASETVPSISLGLGIKYFINKHICLNIETRDLINFKQERTENNLWLGFGLGIRFNLSPRKTNRDSRVKILNRYLREDYE